MAKKNIEIPKESCSARIRKALAIRGMKQSELCEKTKIPKSALSEYLKGLYEPKQDRLVIMADALGVDPVWLMGFDVPMESKQKASFMEQLSFSTEVYIPVVLDNKAKKDLPAVAMLTEKEKVMLDLFRQIPEDQQELALAMLQAALCRVCK